MKWLPNSLEEGNEFQAQFCFNCKRDIDAACKIRDKALLQTRFSVDLNDYPDEWILDDKGEPMCEKYIVDDVADIAWEMTIAKALKIQREHQLSVE